MAEPNTLSVVHRFVTDHDKSGQAIFNRDTEEVMPWKRFPDGVAFGLGYATNQTPVDLNDKTDITTYQEYLQTLPGIMIPGGTVLRIVDMPPGLVSPMHRTVSLDYGVVIEGSVDLVLDSGEVRRMHRGDIAIQRGTNHEWRNVSSTSWARMLYVLQEAKPVSIEGKELDEDYGGMQDTRPSRG